MIRSYLPLVIKSFLLLFSLYFFVPHILSAQTQQTEKSIHIADFEGTAKELLDWVGSQENLTFSYSSEITLGFHVEFSDYTHPLPRFLTSLFKNQPIDYKISQNKVLLFPRQVQPDFGQVIKGRVIDQQTKIELIGANVVIEGTSLGTATNKDGYFRIPNVPLGRHVVKVSYLGYKERLIPEILVGSAKEVVLNIELEEQIYDGQEITVRPGKEKSRPINPISTVSARSFSVEETRRYAGGFDDPARLASSFAGVTYGNAQNNAIIIRGNAPKGLLWRLEGVEISNPNHFPEGNVIGGGLFTIFSNNVLSDSDFFTGAFPAEYGNALSGVFDINFRNGNQDVREYTFQAGMMGIDFSTEGPFSSHGNSSYLVNYRYSTFGLLTDLNIIETEEEIRYQDLSFKLNFPTKKSSTISLWGIGSIDKVTKTERYDSLEWQQDYDRQGYDGEFNIGAVGLNHKYILGNSTFVNSTLAFTTQEFFYNQNRVDDNLTLRNDQYVKNIDSKFIFTSTLTHKYSARLSQSVGVIWNSLFYNLDFKSTSNSNPDSYQTYVIEKGNSQLIQAFTQAQFSLSPAIEVSGGLHSMYFKLNGNYSIEPRAGLRADINSRNRLSFGYGRHSQLEDLQYYRAMQQTDTGSFMPNKNLEFTKADHFVIGYEHQLTSNTSFKVEPYYQFLFDVPVIPDSSFSLINLQSERYINSTMTNEGTGKNYGVDITLEKSLSNHYYYMITGSLFESTYKGGDGIERDTRYNRHFVVNVLGGKEFTIKKHNILGINGRFTYSGAERTHPLLREKSIEEETAILDASRAFEKTFSAPLYLDITISYQINLQKSAHAIALMIKNVLGAENEYGYYYDYQTQSLEMDKTVITLPSISYKIEF